MPQLPNIKFRVEGKTETWKFSAVCSVKIDGEFSVELDPKLQHIAQLLVPSHSWVTGDARGKPFCDKGVHVGFITPDTMRVYAKALDDAKEFIRVCAGIYLECEIKTEQVIVYRHRAQVAFCRDSSGKVWPDGISSHHSAEWVDIDAGISATRRVEMYQVGLFARVFDKTTISRGGIVTYEYKEARFDDSRFSEFKLYGDALNRFCGIDTDATVVGSTEIPYTEDAAKLFYECMMSMCLLAERMHKFMSNPAAVQHAIASGARPVLGA
jgi:hypothetical protein